MYLYYRVEYYLPNSSIYDSLSQMLGPKIKLNYLFLVLNPAQAINGYIRPIFLTYLAYDGYILPF